VAPKGRLTSDDRHHLHELVSRAAWGYDEARLDVVASCFATVAVMTVEVAGFAAPTRVEGRDAIVELIRASIESQGDQRRHVMSNVFIESDDAEEPVVVSTLTLVVVAEGQARIVSCGTYRDVMVRDEGEWRIRRRDLKLDLPY
jgi:hypothetical protein